jgi:hypothetical protein
MEVWAGSVELGNIVCAERVYAPLDISAIRFGMGASAMASGRKPSMVRISARRARGAGVGVMVGVEVKVNVGVRVKVGVTVAVGVDEGVGVVNHKFRLAGI